MARKPTIHRGAIRVGTPAVSDLDRRRAAALRGAATKAELASLREKHGAKVVDAGWTKVRGRRADVRLRWFEMLRTQSKEYARVLQLQLIDDLGLEEPYGVDEWRDNDWAWAWY